MSTKLLELRMFSLETIGQRVRALRKENNLTLKELSEKTDIVISNIGFIENDKNKPSVANILKLCNFFNVSADWLLTGKEYKNDLSEIEADIVKHFRLLDNEQQKSIHQILKSIKPIKKD